MTQTTPNPTRLTFQGGGWVIVLAALVSGLVLLVVLVPALRRPHPPGDGQDPSTYGFALTPSLLPEGSILCAQQFRDAISSMENPPTLDAAGVVAANKAMRGKFLVPRDRVVGVVAGDQARAYPLALLASHEVINDVVGGVPIAVAYNGPCDSVVVFVRRIGEATLEFGLSGLVHDSHHLLYDRRFDGAPESLWSPILGRAVTGPATAAGLTMPPMPVELTQWGDWLARHPATTVARPEAIEDIKQLRELSYERYYQSEELLYPVDPPPPADGPSAKTPCVIVDAGGERRVYFVPEIQARAGESDTWQASQGDASLRFDLTRQPVTCRVQTTDGETPPVVYALWFAWHAMNPDVGP